MAATETTKNKTPKFRARKSCFPACFGLSSDASKPEGEDLDGKSSPEKNGRKKPQWKTTTENAGSGGEKNNFRWPKLRKKKSGRKTVPVDAPVAEKTTLGQNSNEEIREETEELTEIQDPVGKSQILGSLVLKRVQSPVVALPCSVVGVAEPDQGGKPRKGMFTNYRSQQKLQNEGQKPPESSIPGTELSQKPAISNRRTLSYGGREIDNRKPGSQPASPENKTKLSMISSSSFPPPGGRKNAHTPRLSRLGNRNPNRETGNIAGEFDPVVGLSVLMITLAIMLLWGRICAIICTSAWFYFVPRLKTVINSGEVAGNEKHSGELDINSSEYKKKVIMEGLLERSHRNAAGIS